MHDFQKNDNTVVIVYPQDHNNALSSIPEMVERLREKGIAVVLIGDGKRELTLEEIEKELKKVEGPASLYIAAHGGENGEVGGITKENTGLDGVIDKFWYFDANRVDGADLFKIVPENFNTIVAGSCFGEINVEDAVKYLPKGTIFFPEWAKDTLGYSTRSSKFFFQHQSGKLMDGTTEVTAPEFFFQIANKVHNPTDTAESLRRQGKEDIIDEFNEIMSRNFPETIAIGGVGIVNLKNELKNITNENTSDQDIKEFLEEYDKLIQQKVDYIDIIGNKRTFQLGIDPDTGEYSEDLAIEQMRFFISVKEEGQLSPDDPYYVLMHAFAFDQSEVGKELDYDRDKKHVVANRQRMSIDDVFYKEALGPGHEDFGRAGYLYNAAVKTGACEEGKPFIVKVDDQHYLVRPGKDGFPQIEVAPVYNHYSIDMNLPNNPGYGYEIPPDNRHRITIDELFNKGQYINEDFDMAGLLYKEALDSGKCEEGEPFLVHVNNQYFLVRSGPEGFPYLEVASLRDNQYSVDFDSPSNPRHVWFAKMSPDKLTTNHQRMAIDDIFSKKAIDPEHKDFSEAGSLYAEAIGRGECEEGKPHIVEVDDRFYLVRSGKDGLPNVEIVPIENRYSVDFDSPNIPNQGFPIVPSITIDHAFSRRVVSPETSGVGAQYITAIESGECEEGDPLIVQVDGQYYLVRAGKEGLPYMEVAPIDSPYAVDMDSPNNPSRGFKYFPPEPDTTPTEDTGQIASSNIDDAQWEKNYDSQMLADMKGTAKDSFTDKAANPDEQPQSTPEIASDVTYQESLFVVI